MSKRPSFLRLFTERGPLTVLAVAGAMLFGIAAPPSAAASPARWRRRIFFAVRRRVRARPAAATAGAPRGLFARARARQARHRGRAERAGARRCDGRLAGLRPRGCIGGNAGAWRDPQAQDGLRPVEISAQGRAVGLDRRGEGNSGERKSGCHRRDARPSRSRVDPGSRSRQEGRNQAGRQGREEGCARQAGRNRRGETRRRRVREQDGGQQGR